MKLSKLWLHDWVDFSSTAQELADQLTMAGLEVDAVVPVAGAFTQVVIAEVLSTEPHPNADKLTLCTVQCAEDQILKIVCGASNVRAGLKVALAKIGAELPGGFKIKESKLRGELSQGMLCSASELGLAEQAEGIIELDKDAPIGQDLRTYLQLDDFIFDFDLTPNRADCFSALGIAREIAVLNKLSLKTPEIKAYKPELDEVLTIQVMQPEACPRYCGRMIFGINAEADTPVWMMERLRRSGIRALHPVVDVLNYVMLELGQPLHAFDLAQVKGEIRVRWSEPAEEIHLLNGKTLSLKDQSLVIADEERALALAGIMGGLDSAVQTDTQDIFIESAYFDPLIIGKTARSTPLFSDSSQRFERGVDPNLQRQALERATALLVSIVGGRVGPVIEKVEPKALPKKISLSFDTTKVVRLTGLQLSEQQIKALLEGLGILIIQEQGSVLEVEIPSYRFDIEQEVDLVEEIIRLYGYDQLRSEPIQAQIKAGTTSLLSCIEQKLGIWFQDRGYHETISYSFVDPELQSVIYPNQEVMHLLNPISPELSQMRAGLWPGLLASMMYNLHRQQNMMKLFETGIVFEVNEGHLKERPCIAGLITGEQGSLNWSETKSAFNFFDLKGDLQSLFSVLKLETIEWAPAEHEALHPGQSAFILHQGQRIGLMGVLHPKLADALDVSHEVLLFELNLEALMTHSPIRYQSISKYPQIRRDLSFLVDNEITVLQIEQTIRACFKENWLKTFHVFDLYVGKGVPEGKKSLAVAMTLQDEHRTLVDVEINLLINAIIKSLQEEFSITLRD